MQFPKSNTWLMMLTTVAITAFSASAAQAASFYISVDRADSVVEYDENGSLVGLLDQGNHRNTNGAISVEFDSNNNLYLSRGYSNAIHRYNSEKDRFEVFTKGGSLFGPHQFAFSDFDSDLYVANYNNGTVQRFDGKTGIFKEVVASGLGNAVGVDTDSSGNVYITSRNQHRVYKFDGSNLSIFARVTHPEGVALSPDGYVYISQYQRAGGDMPKSNGWGNILRYQQDGTPFGVGGNTLDSQFINNDGFAFTSMDFDSNSNLYAVDYLGQQVVRYHGLTGEFIDVFIEENPLSSLGVYGIAFTEDSVTESETVPEPSSILSLLALGLITSGSLLKRKELNC